GRNSAAVSRRCVSEHPDEPARATRLRCGVCRGQLMYGLPRWFHRFGSPPYVYRLADRWRPWLAWSAALALAAGAFGGLVLAPPDYLQGDSFRIIYVHVPSAYLSMM